MENYNKNFENQMKDYSTKREEIINFIKENFNEDEIIKIDADDTFNGMYVKTKYYGNRKFEQIERAIHECECVAKEIDWCERPWVKHIIDTYKDNITIMATIWACYNGITADEIFEII